MDIIATTKKAPLNSVATITHFILMLKETTNILFAPVGNDTGKM